MRAYKEKLMRKIKETLNDILLPFNDILRLIEFISDEGLGEVEGFDNIILLKKRIEKYKVVIKKDLDWSQDESIEAQQELEKYAKMAGQFNKINIEREIAAALDEPELKEETKKTVDELERAKSVAEDLPDLFNTLLASFGKIVDTTDSRLSQELKSTVQYFTNQKKEILSELEEDGDIKKTLETLDKIKSYVVKSELMVKNLKSTAESIDRMKGLNDLLDKMEKEPEETKHYAAFHKELTVLKTQVEDFKKKTGDLKGELPNVAAFVKRKMDFSLRTQLEAMASDWIDLIEGYEGKVKEMY